MGIFHDMVEVINLAPVPLTVTFDGQSTEIAPGVSALPRIVIQHAKNQNPIRGSQDMDNPNISGGRYLISLKNRKGERQEPLTKDEWNDHLGKPSRYDMDAFYEDTLGRGERVMVRGKGRAVQAKSAFEAGVRMTAPEVIPETV